VAPEPYEFCNVRVQSLIGDKEDDHFQVGDDPTLRITVTNKNGPECRIAIEVHTATTCVQIQGGTPWREEKKHGGEMSRGKRQWDYDVPLRLVAPGDAQMLTIKLFMCGLSEDEPIYIDEYEHAIWVSS
jgi:hypothetical protein